MKNILMKKLSMLFIGLMLLLLMSSNSMAESYWVHGAAASEVNGLYEYYGTYDTYKSDGLYSNLDMPVYKKTVSNYYLAYRG